MAQRMSVALHMAAAWEIARELSLAGAEDEAALFGARWRGRRLRCLNSHRSTIVPGACAPWRRLSVVVFPCVSVCGYPVRTECGNACGSQDLQTHFLL